MKPVPGTAVATEQVKEAMRVRHRPNPKEVQVRRFAGWCTGLLLALMATAMALPATEVTFDGEEVMTTHVVVSTVGFDQPIPDAHNGPRYDVLKATHFISSRTD